MALESYIRIMKAYTKMDEASGCWLYTKSVCPATGYGRIQVATKRMHVHRISTAYHHGLDLNNSNEFACHKCENRNCWNPDHLYKGDNHSNQLDCSNAKTFAKYLQKNAVIGSKSNGVVAI